MKKKIWVPAAGAASLLLIGIATLQPAAATPRNVVGVVNVPMHASLVVEALNCSNTGSEISLQGGATTDPVPARVNYKSPSGKKAPATSGDGNVVFGATGGDGVPKQGSVGGVGGNPWIYITDEDNNTTLLGRCVQGFKAQWSSNPMVSVPVSVEGAATSCATSSTEVAVRGLEAHVPASDVTISFDSKRPDNPSSPRPHSGSTTASFEILTSQSIPGLTHRYQGIGGNPEVYLNMDANNASAADIYLGRCRSLL